MEMDLLPRADTALPVEGGKKQLELIPLPTH